MALTLINLVGAKASGRLQNVVVVGLVGILLVFAARGFFAIDVGTLRPFNPEGWGGIVTTTGLVFISYLGIVKATALAGEAKDPGRTLPLALLGAVVFVTLLYVAVMLILTGVIPLDAIADSNAPVAEAGQLLFGALGGAIVALAGILATVSTANAAVLSSSRFPFAMARDGLAHPRLGQTSERFKTPTASILVTGGVMLGLAVVLDVEQIAKLGGTFGILVFVLLNVMVVLLRASRPEWYDPDYHVPFSPILPIIGALAALALIPFMGLLSQVSAVVFVIAGIAWYAYQSRGDEEVSPDYDIRDQLKRVEYRRALEDKETRFGEPNVGAHILVEIEEERPNRILLLVLAAFAARMDARLEVLVITEVPDHVPLGEYDPEIDTEWMDKLERRLDEHDCETAFHHVLARDRTTALLERITEQTELIVVDWHDPIRKYHLRESHVDELLRMDMPVRLAVLKHRGAREFEEIVVATDDTPYDRAEVELADAIASASGARLTLVKVVPAEASQEAATTAEDYLAGLLELVDSEAATEVLYDDDVRAALIDRGNEADLLVLGAPSHPDRFHDFFGQTTDIVAAETDVSVLVAKEPEAFLPWYQRVWRFLTRH